MVWGKKPAVPMITDQEKFKKILPLLWKSLIHTHLPQANYTCYQH